MNYAKAIRVARSLADISQGQLADRADIDRSYLSLIESGKRIPSIETIEKISAALKLPFHLLTLLGSEETDVKNASHAQITSLSEALAKLLLQIPDDEPAKISGPEHATRKAVRKPARPRTQAGSAQRDTPVTRQKRSK